MTSLKNVCASNSLKLHESTPDKIATRSFKNTLGKKDLERGSCKRMSDVRTIKSRLYRNESLEQRFSRFVKPLADLVNSDAQSKKQTIGHQIILKI